MNPTAITDTERYESNDLLAIVLFTVIFLVVLVVVLAGVAAADHTTPITGVINTATVALQHH